MSDDLEERLQSLTSERSAERRKQHKEEKEKKRRGPGRPRKQKLDTESETAPAADEPEQDPDDVPRVASVAPVEDDKETLKRVKLVDQINTMKKRLNAVGTGMEPNAALHSLSELKAEFELLNQQVNSRRGDDALRNLTCTVIAPALTVVAEKVGDFIERNHGLPRPIDLEGLDKEVYNNWEDMFQEVAVQIAINHPEWFSHGPLVTYVEAIMSCAASANMKNQARKLKAASSRLSEQQPVQLVNDPAKDSRFAT